MHVASFVFSGCLVLYKPKVPSLVPSRFFLGALNGLMATTTTMISEVCGSEHEVVGMSFVIGDVTADLQESFIQSLCHISRYGSAKGEGCPPVTCSRANL